MIRKRSQKIFYFSLRYFWIDTIYRTIFIDNVKIVTIILHNNTNIEDTVCLDIFCIKNQSFEYY